jgi:hypothetical protein
MAPGMPVSYYTLFHTSAEAIAVFDQVFGSRLTFAGFKPVGPRRWVQETGKGFKYLFYLHQQANGVSYLPGGAISADFVPRLARGKWRLQPDAKHATVHLSFGTARKTRFEWEIYKNRDGFRDKVEKIAGESVTEITEWFENFQSVLDVVAAIDRAKADLGSGFYNYPVMVLAYAFTLARVHRTDAARAEFRQALDSSYFDLELNPGLQHFFDAEINSRKS